MRKLVVTLFAAVLLATSSPSAEAVSVSGATFSGSFSFTNPPSPIPSPGVTYRWDFTTTSCTENALHPVDPTKPSPTSGSCLIEASGTYVGNCAVGVGSGSGWYTDSRGQRLPFLITAFIADAASWRWTGTIRKTHASTNRQGNFTAGGEWLESATACEAVATIGTFSYTLGM